MYGSKIVNSQFDELTALLWVTNRLPLIYEITPPVLLPCKYIWSPCNP